MTMQTQSPSTPAFNAYVVLGDGEEARWNHIGAAWHHRDGKGLSIAIAAMPVGGRIVLREPRRADETSAQ